MFSAQEEIELIIKGRKNYNRAIHAIRNSDIVQETKSYCNHVILDVNEERAFNTFYGMGSIEKLQFVMLLSELFDDK